MDRTTVISLTSVLIALGATGSIAERAASAGETAFTAASTNAAADNRFEVSVERPKTAAAGKPTKARIRMTPKAPWHVNLDYPTSLTLEATAGIQLAKPKLKKADATRLDEGGVEFTVTLTPQAAGNAKVKGTLRFAVCQDDSCAPARAPVVIEVAAR